MTKVMDETGKWIHAVGTVHSYARMKAIYYITLPKLVQHINKVFDNDGVSRHCDIEELRDICELNGVQKGDWDALTKAAYFYSNAKHDNYIL